MNEFDLMNDRDLFERLERAVAAQVFEQSEGWRLMAAACQRVALAAEKKLVKIDPEKTLQIVELQQIAKLYGDALGNLLKSFHQDGEAAFVVAQDRGLLTERSVT